MESIITYAKQASTWRGLITLLGAFGVAISPELAEVVIAACVACFGVVEVVRNEQSSK